MDPSNVNHVDPQEHRRHALWHATEARVALRTVVLWQMRQVFREVEQQFEPLLIIQAVEFSDDFG